MLAVVGLELAPPGRGVAEGALHLGVDPKRVHEISNYVEVNHFYNKYREVCDDRVFIQLLRQIF